MGFLLKSGEVGNIGLKHQKAIREATVNKWGELGFLEGLDGYVKENMALLFENQASVLMEGTSTEGGASTGSFETVVFPIVRRVFSKLLANDIVSVQALNLPIGKLFYFVPKVSDRVTDSDFDDNLNNGTSSHSDMVAINCLSCAKGSTYTGSTKNLYDVFYNDGLYDQSKGKITLNVVEVEGVTGIDSDTPGQGPLATDGTLRHQIIKVTGFTSAGAGRLLGPDGHEMDTESFLASLIITKKDHILSGDNGAPFIEAGTSIPFRVVTQRYGKGIVNYGDICTANGEIFVEVDLTHPVCMDCDANRFDGYIGATGSTVVTGGTFEAIWRQYAELEMESQLGEVSFELESVTVSVTERKLRATWTPELAQDVNAFHNIDAEAELTALLSEQVAAEIDREILMDLRKGAAWTLKWDYNGWKRLPNNNGYTQKDWNQTLITAINQISAQIHKSTLRGGANFIVVSSEVSAVFDDLEYFHVSNASPEEDQYNMGIEKVGSLSGRYTVYRDPYAPAYSILIGHKGKSLLDTGYIYAPYIPLQLTPTMYNPFNFVPVKGIMTRYAKRMVNNRFYGSIRVDGLRTFDVRELR
jgi:hypothetical protein